MAHSTSTKTCGNTGQVQNAGDRKVDQARLSSKNIYVFSSSLQLLKTPPSLHVPPSAVPLRVTRSVHSRNASIDRDCGHTRRICAKWSVHARIWMALHGSSRETFPEGIGFAVK